jgi:hypothetical protein
VTGKVDPEERSVVIYQIFDFWIIKYLSEIVEACSLIPTTLSSFLQYPTTTGTKVWLRLTAFDFKNVKLLTDILQWLQTNPCCKTAQTYSWCSSNFNLVIWWGKGVGTWLHKLKILRLRTTEWDDSFVKTMLVFH